ncbi:MAG: HD domain-containing protein [Saprospiraceae bacterium]|nr:HD domain-containing protein [Saprospiraceae bacterium]MDW8229936.1 HD domain-containing protein [Saprospiraceae bacterium]
MNYRAAEEYILHRLRTELSERLLYHGLEHTLDVLQAAESLCMSEGVIGREATLVKTAALFHDAGFVRNRHAGHEHEGCLIVREALPHFGYTPTDIEVICGMIMATKIPQSPANLLEAILCDADLDYLGRADFYRIGRNLYEELLSYGLLHGEEAWNRLQVNFLTQHRYHTATNIALREPVKQRYLEELRELVASYDE